MLMSNRLNGLLLVACCSLSLPGAHLLAVAEVSSNARILDLQEQSAITGGCTADLWKFCLNSETECVGCSGGIGADCDQPTYVAAGSGYNRCISGTAVGRTFCTAPTELTCSVTADCLECNWGEGTDIVCANFPFENPTNIEYQYQDTATGAACPPG